MSRHTISVHPRQKMYIDLTHMVGSDLYLTRKLNDVSQKQMADTLECNPSTVSKHLAMGNNLTLRTLADLAWAMDGEVEISIKPKRRDI